MNIKFPSNDKYETASTLNCNSIGKANLFKKIHYLLKKNNHTRLVFFMKRNFLDFSEKDLDVKLYHKLFFEKGKEIVTFVYEGIYYKFIVNDSFANDNNIDIKDMTSKDFTDREKYNFLN